MLNKHGVGTLYFGVKNNGEPLKQDISEDEVDELQDDVQKLTDKYIKEVDAAVERKSKEIMTV